MPALAPTEGGHTNEPQGFFLGIKTGDGGMTASGGAPTEADGYIIVDQERRTTQTAITNDGMEWAMGWGGGDGNVLV